MLKKQVIITATLQILAMIATFWWGYQTKFYITDKEVARKIKSCAYQESQAKEYCKGALWVWDMKIDDHYKFNGQIEVRCVGKEGYFKP